MEARGLGFPLRGRRPGWSAEMSVASVKERMIESGITACETCGWSCPEPLTQGFSPLRLLELHHVVPVDADGRDSEDNLVLVCLNCHRVAHALWLVRKPDGEKRYTGPLSAEAFIQEMRAFLFAPERWWKIRRPMISTVATP